ncbi:hypothetical protein HMPREF2955_14705 [Prevotella sp. HMSC073D09]|uniref:hypothetical protein n=1 Tax=Prevotella sp. HMSC073D09 TaxID=1739459 RepID=UPI0008A413DD|nr:hypothetical protein [Prevotella sp. HMSC073D09]OFQ11652.1 hypothetical protein HMPREF2955_14705 [Prevotella sp. HMSC073D09]
MRTISIKNLSALLLMLVMGMSLTTACSSSDDNEVDNSIVTRMVGTYKATIAPTMGNKKMAEGPHTLYIERAADAQQVRIHYEGFNAPFLGEDGKPLASRMPFDMAVDFTLDVTPGKNGELQLKSVKGFFKATPHNGESVKPGQAPGGIAIPDPKGFETDRATAEGTWKDNKLVLRIFPNILPVVVNVEAAK